MLIDDQSTQWLIAGEPPNLVISRYWLCLLPTPRFPKLPDLRPIPATGSPWGRPLMILNWKFMWVCLKMYNMIYQKYGIYHPKITGYNFHREDDDQLQMFGDFSAFIPGGHWTCLHRQNNQRLCAMAWIVTTIMAFSWGILAIGLFFLWGAPIISWH